jgi:hypothetical protein
MKIVKWIPAAALVVAMLSGCSIVFNGNLPPVVSLEASSTWMVTGQVSVLTATASDPEGETLTYEWSEDGSPLAGTDSILSYWKAVESRASVTVSVVVRDGHGNATTASVDLIVDPRYDGAVLVVNNSTEDVWWFTDHKAPDSWSGDRLGADIILAGTSHLVINTDVYGYSSGSWDLKAETSDYGIYWEVDSISMWPGRVYQFILTD